MDGGCNTGASQSSAVCSNQIHTIDLQSRQCGIPHDKIPHVGVEWYRRHDIAHQQTAVDKSIVAGHHVRNGCTRGRGCKISKGVKHYFYTPTSSM